MWDTIKAALDSLGGFFSWIWNAIASWFAPIIDSIGNWFEKASGVQERIIRLIGKIEALIANVEREIEQIKSFKFDPHWNSRVIHVPTAIDQLKHFLIEVPKEVANKAKALVTDVKALFGLFEHGGGAVGMSDVPAGIQKTVGWASMIDQIFESVEFFVDDLSTIVDDIRQLREEIEALDILFLPQGKPERPRDPNKVGSTRIVDRQ